MKYVGSFFLLVVLALAPTAAALAQQQPSLEGSGIAEYVRIPDADVEDGEVIALEGEQYRPADRAYSPHLYGVVNLQPAVALNQVGGDQTYPVLQKGVTSVQVSARNGAVAPGDFLTSSPDAGVAMKATQAGFVLGTARGSFEGEEGETGTVPVALNIRFVTSVADQQLTPRSFVTQAQDVVTVGLRAVASEPNDALRYISAALVLIVSLGIGFFIFGRSATNGIVAIGRNPLARKSVIAVTIFNVSMTIVIAGGGVGLALFILAV